MRQVPRSRLDVIGAQRAGFLGGKRVACMGYLDFITIPPRMKRKSWGFVQNTH
jgi:hypothetical protein